MLEVDEWHLAAVAGAVRPAVVVLLYLTRDQLDRGTEVRAVATAVGAALAGLPRTLVVANVDDPMVVWAAGNAARVCWVAAGAGWLGDTATCPRCGSMMHTDGPAWGCGCGLARPEPDWWLDGDLLHTGRQVTRLALRLPGRCNIGNAAQAVAAAAAVGVEPERAAAAMGELATVAGRFAVIGHGGQGFRPPGGVLRQQHPQLLPAVTDDGEPAGHRGQFTHCRRRLRRLDTHRRGGRNGLRRVADVAPAR